jgi:hypothetical protein
MLNYQNQKRKCVLQLFVWLFIIILTLSSFPVAISETAHLPAILNPQTREGEMLYTMPEVTDQTVVYAIICSWNLSTTLNRLAAWKTEKGVPAKIYIINGPDGIYANYEGRDNASKIHNFLTSMHENNSNLEWVLLVGDEDIIPSRLVYVNASDPFGLDDYYYSDLYYAGLNNSWDQDGDGIYGEQKGDVGWYANLYVGRLPVNNVSETKTVIDKIIKYESGATAGQWMKNATFWSGLLDGPNNASAYQSYKDNAIKLTNKILPNVPEYMNINHLYDYNELSGGNYLIDNDILNHNTAKSSFYSGHSLINFAGQAYYTGDELAHYMDETGISAVPDGFGSLFSYNDGKYAYNGDKLPLVYLSTCSVNFSERDDSNLEQLLTAPDGGAIALIGNSGKSYRGETENGSSFGNWWLDERFFELFFINGYTQPGKSLYELKKSYVMDVISQGVPYIQMAVANLVGYNLLGDPELSIWTDIPKDLNISTSITLDETHRLQITVTNTNGAPVQNARVCVYNNESYEYNTTDSNGIAFLDLDPRRTSTLETTVTAHNYLPFHTNFRYENKPPVIDQAPDITIDEDSKTNNALNLSEYITDQDNTIAQLEISLTNITNPKVGVSLDESNLINIDPELNWFGFSDVTVRVSDGIVEKFMKFTITVQLVNDPPRVNEIAEQHVKAGKTFRYEVFAFDIEDDKLTYSDDSDMFNIDPDTGVINFKTKDKHAGRHTITIFVSDGTDTSNVTFDLYVESESEPDFLLLYGFPIAVIVGMFVVIIIVLVRSRRKSPDDTESEPVNKDKTKRSSRSQRSKKGNKKKK